MFEVETSCMLTAYRRDISQQMDDVLVLMSKLSQKSLPFRLPLHHAEMLMQYVQLIDACKVSCQFYPVVKSYVGYVIPRTFSRPFTIDPFSIWVKLSSKESLFHWRYGQNNCNNCRLTLSSATTGVFRAITPCLHLTSCVLFSCFWGWRIPCLNHHTLPMFTTQNLHLQDAIKERLKGIPLSL